jgi:hypothetical protein
MSQSKYFDITIRDIHSLKVMGNSSVDSKDLFPLNYDFVNQVIEHCDVKIFAL